MANQWKEKTPYPGDGTCGSFSFTLNGKGYVGSGWETIAKNNTVAVWEFDPAGNSGDGSWTQMDDFPGLARCYSVAFSIDSVGKGYVGTGMHYLDETSSNVEFLEDFWEFDPSAAKQWTQLKNVPGKPRCSAVGFSLRNKGYIGLGGGLNSPGGNVVLDDFWVYDPIAKTWTPIDVPFPGGARDAAVAFTMEGKAYIGTGDVVGSPRDTHDLYEYDPNRSGSAKWKRKADLPIIPVDFDPPLNPWLFSAVGFSIKNNGYIGTGRGNLHGDKTSIIQNFWKFTNDAGLGRWEEIEPFPDLRCLAVGFCIGDKGYAGTGENGPEDVYYSDFYEYEP